MSSSFRWALDPNIYSIPKPFGEIVSWRVYKRDEENWPKDIPDSELESDLQWRIFNCGKQNGNYFLELFAFGSNLGFGKKRGNEDTVFGPMTTISNRIIKVTFNNNVDVESVVKTYKASSNLLDRICYINGDAEKKYQADGCNAFIYIVKLSLEKSLLKEILDTLSVVSVNLDDYSEDQNTVPESDQDDRECQFKLVDVPLLIGEDTISLTFHFDTEYGWGGDPLNHTQKNNNNDEASYHLEITSEVFVGDQRLESANSFSSAPTRWSAMQLAITKLDEAASGIVQQQLVETDKTRQAEWIDLLSKIQTKIEDAINFEISSGDPRKIVILKPDEKSANTWGGEKYINMFETTPFKFDIFRYTRDKAPTSFFTGELMNKCDPDEIISNIFTKPRSHKTASGKKLALMSGSDIVPVAGDYDRDLLVDDTPKVDLPQSNFEHDINMTNTDQFIMELSTCLRLIGQCLVSTVQKPSIDSQSEQLGFESITSKDLKEETNAALCKLDIEISKRETKNNTKSECDANKYYATVFSDQNVALTEQVFDRHTGWTKPTQTDFGACSELLWRPVVESTNENKDVYLGNIGAFIVSQMPFGSPSLEQTNMIEQIVKTALDQFLTNESFSKVILERKDDAENMPYEPVLLKYGITFTSPTEHDFFDSFSWSIGSLSTLFVESLTITMIFLQKILFEQSKTSNLNRPSDIRSREKKSKLDIYPGGFATKYHDEANDKYMDTISDDKVIEQLYGTTNLKPGSDAFYKLRSAIRKEIMYKDSRFQLNRLPDVDNLRRSSYMSPWKDILAFQTITTGSGVPEVSVYTKTTDNLAEFIRKRFRLYSGLDLNKHTETSLEKNQYYTTAFDTSIEKYIYHLPDYLLGTESSVLEPNDNTEANVFEKLGQWLASTFVGWSFSNLKSMDRVVFALACNKYYDQLMEYFGTIDKRFNEPRGVNIFDDSPTQRPIITLMKIVYSEQQKILGQQNTSMLVIPGVVLVKDGGTSALTTKCITKQFLVKSDTFRVVESEMWSTLKTKLIHIRGLPPGSHPRCLAALLKAGDRFKTKTYLVNDLLKVRPEIATALARLMVAIRISNNTWTNTSKYRYNESVHMGAAYIEEAVFEILFRL